MKHITKESHAQLYEEGHQVNKVGTEGLFAMADKRDAEFVNAYDVSENKFVRFAILPCNEDNLESDQKCAERAEVSKWFQSV